MGDSFFTSSNQYDPEIDRQGFDVQQSALLIEAATRRMVRLEGPIAVAHRLQRISDICAGVYVLPIEHWRGHEQKKPEPKPEPKPAPLSWRWRLWVVIRDNPALSFWGGFLLGLYWEGFWR